MIDTFYIGAYWASRKENIIEVVEKAVQTLKLIADIDEQFTVWYELGTSRKRALEKNVKIESSDIYNLFIKRLKKGELDEFGFTTHFFSLSLWSGHAEDEACNMSFNAGGEFNTNSLANSCVLSIPTEGEARERLLKIDKMKSLIEVLVRIWNPDNVVLVSKQLKKELGTINEIGWLTYLKNLKKAPKLSGKVVQEPFRTGDLFYLESDNNDAYNYELLKELLPLVKVAT